MSESRMCADFGGTRADGKPCTRKAAWGRRGLDTGPCRDHAPEADAKLQANKKAFLETLKEPRGSLQVAAHRIGVDPATVWRWRQADAEFDAEVKAVRAETDAHRVEWVEDALLTRLLAGQASAAEMIFYLCNRAPDRWKHVQRHEHEHRSKPLETLLDEALAGAGDASG